MRYDRQIRVSELGRSGQALLQNSRVLLVGMGGLGCPAALYLAGAGIGTLGLVDADTVSLSNLHRQILYSAADEGTPKVLAAKKRLLELNPELSVSTHAFDLNAGNVLELFSNYDLVIDGTDRFGTKLLINDACLKLGLPWVYASVSQWEGQVAFFDSTQSALACYRCLQPGIPKVQIQNCAESGVIGPVVGILGTEQALLAIQQLSDLKPVPSTLQVFDGLRHSWLKVKIKKNETCIACSRAPETIELKDAENLSCSFAKAEWVTARELQAQLAANRHDFILLDVREQNEWDDFHLVGAVHWPMGKIEKNLFPELPAKKIVVYCQSGKRSARAAIALAGHGYDQLFDLKGGINEWPRN